MRERTAANTLASATEVFSLIGLLVPRLFKAIGWVEWAQGLSDVMALFKSPAISWEGIYLFLAVLSGTALIGVNFSAAAGWLRERRQHKLRPWDTSAINAINHIAYNSHFGKAITGESPISVALAAFAEAASTGRLKTVGRRPRQRNRGANQEKHMAILLCESSRQQDRGHRPEGDC